MIIVGDAAKLPLADASVQTVVTSPPYWGLRDYGVEGQIGLEESPRAFVDRLVAVFREARRVLRDDGTLWLNLGDTYIGGRNGGMGPRSNVTSKRNHGAARAAWLAQGGRTHRRGDGLKPKDLVGIPWMVAFALREDGWYLRADIVWHKPNPMPESVRDRPTKAHEYIFLFSKSERYHYDADAIMEPVTGGAHTRGHGSNPKARMGAVGSRQNESFSEAVKGLVSERNKRSVWTVASQPFKGAHFATFPSRLIEPCILAGAPPGGVVLDPFFGTGTTGVVALRLGRRAVGVELSPVYAAMAAARLRGVQPGLPIDLGRRVPMGCVA